MENGYETPWNAKIIKNKVLHPFTAKPPLAILTSALNSSTGSCGMVTSQHGHQCVLGPTLDSPTGISPVIPIAPTTTIPIPSPTPSTTHITFPSRTSNAESTPHTPAHDASTSDSSGPYMDEDVPLILQLLAYLSRYPHLRQAFYKPSAPNWSLQLLHHLLINTSLHKHNN